MPQTAIYNDWVRRGKPRFTNRSRYNVPLPRSYRGTAADDLATIGKRNPTSLTDAESWQYKQLYRKSSVGHLCG